MAIKISVSFKDTESEKEMYDYIQSQLSSSIYIKGLIKKDMEENKPVAKKVNTNFGMDF